MKYNWIERPDGSLLLSHPNGIWVELVPVAVGHPIGVTKWEDENGTPLRVPSYSEHPVRWTVEEAKRAVESMIAEVDAVFCELVVRVKYNQANEGGDR